MSSNNSPSQREYHAFISYRHADNREPGRQWATWLHQAIETYEVPEDLVGKVNGRGEVIPDRIYPVFRDEEELPANADLGNSIAGALRSSRLLIILCSPNAVASTYVADEISYFKELGHSDRIIAAMISGEPNASWDKAKQAAGTVPEQECFPLPLQFVVDDQGELTEERAEPIAADFRVNIGGRVEQGWCSLEAFRQHLKQATNLATNEVESEVKKYARQQQLMLLKVIAGILGVPLGELTQRDKEYQLLQAQKKARRLRQWLSGVAALAVIALLAGATAYWQQQIAIANEQKALENEDLAKEQRDRSLIGQSRFLFDQARQANQNGEHDLALLLGLNALPGPYGEQRPKPNALAELRRAIVDTEKQFHMSTEQEIGTASFSPDGNSLLVVTESPQAKIYDIRTGEVTVRLGEDTELETGRFSRNGQFVALADSFGNIDVWNLRNQNRQKLVSSPSGSSFTTMVFGQKDKTLFAATLAGNLVGWSLETGEELFRLKTGGGASDLVVSPDNKLLLHKTAFSNEIVVWSTVDGKEVQKFLDDGKAWFGLSGSRSPSFLGQQSDEFLAYSQDGTYNYSIENGSRTLATPHSHMLINDEGSHGVMMPIHQPLRSDIENFEMIESLKTSPVLMDFKNETSKQLQHIGDVNDAHFSADGQFLLTTAYHTAYLWELETGLQVNSFTIPSGKYVSTSPAERWLLSSEFRGRELGLWRLAARSGRTSISKQWRFEESGMSPEGRYAFAVDNEDGSFHFFDTKQGNSVLKLPRDCRRAYPEMGRPVVQYSNSDNLVLVRCDDGDDLLYSLADFKPLELFSGWSKVIPGIHASEVQHRMSADGRYLLYSFRDYQKEGFALVEIRGEEPVWSHTRNYEQDLSLAGMSPSADYLYLYHPPSKRIEVLSPSDGQQHLSLTLERELVEVKLIGNQILLLDNDGQTEVYDLTSGELAWRYEDGVRFSLMTAHAGEGKVVLASKDGDIRWLDLSSGELLISFSGPEEPEALSFLGEGQYLLVQATNSVLLNSASGKPHYPALGYQEHLALNEDGSELIIVSDEGYVRRLPILLDDLVSAAIETLPVNRRCLSDKERESFYLAPLTDKQKRARQCVQP